MPRAGVLALSLGPGADAVAVGLPLLPPPAVCSTVVKVEPAAVDALGQNGRAGGGRHHSGHGVVAGGGPASALRVAA